MFIYLQQSPLKCLEMLKYLDNVRMASEKFRGFGWREYDEQNELGGIGLHPLATVC